MKKDIRQAEELFGKSLSEIQKVFNEDKNKISEIVENMFAYLKQEDWIDDCGLWVFHDVIIMEQGYFLKFVEVLNLAHKCGLDVHDNVENYIEWLISSTLFFSDYYSYIASSGCKEELKVDVRDVLITPLFKPLFTLISDMCKQSDDADLFMKLSDFCNYIKRHDNRPLDEINFDDDDEIFGESDQEAITPFSKNSIYKNDFDKNVFNICLKAFLKRASYKQVEKYLDDIDFLNSYNRKDVTFNFSKYTTNTCKAYYDEKIKQITEAKRDKIFLQLIKKSNRPLSLLREKYPDKSDNRLLCFMVNNKALENSAHNEIQKRLYDKNRPPMDYDEWYELLYGDLFV